MKEKRNNYLVSAICNGKVVDLQYSHDLVDLRAIQLRHTHERKLDGCEFEVITLDGFLVTDTKETENPRRLSRNGNPPNRVKCLETGLVYDTVSSCSRTMQIPERNIYESVRRGVRAYGYHFILVPPLQKFK